MKDNVANIQDFLAAAIRNEPRHWPEAWTGKRVQDRVLEAVLYHGLAGLLFEKTGCFEGWPKGLVATLHKQAIARAMWEMRHRIVVSDLLATLAKARIAPLILKGTAVAYDLLSCPGSRTRGDTDLLVAKTDLAQVRSVLWALGFRPDYAEHPRCDSTSRQQGWTFYCPDGTFHSIDLHWQVMNSPALQNLLTFSECSAVSINLPRLSTNARAMDRVHNLIHTCMHRAMHFTAPYLVDGAIYYGGDRLIWVHDIHLLATSLSEEQWTRLCALADKKGVSAVCLDGLMTAQRSLITPIPNWVCDELRATSRKSQATKYLLHSRQFERAWRDLLAVRGLRNKLDYLLARGLPSPAFLRNKYPSMTMIPLPLLYARRILELVRVRRGRNEAR